MGPKWDAIREGNVFVLKTRNSLSAGLALLIGGSAFVVASCSNAEEDTAKKAEPPSAAASTAAPAASTEAPAASTTAAPAATPVKEAAPAAPSATPPTPAAEAAPAAAPAAPNAAAPTNDSAPAAAAEAAPAGAVISPLERVKMTEKGKLKNPYTDNAEAIAEGKKLYLGNSCNGCHGGGGGGGMCPPLTNETWVYGSDDDTLFRLITLGSVELKKTGFAPIAKESVTGPMPPYQDIIKDETKLWKIIAFVRSVFGGRPEKRNW